MGACWSDRWPGMLNQLFVIVTRNLKCLMYHEGIELDSSPVYQYSNKPRFCKNVEKYQLRNYFGFYSKFSKQA